MIEQRILSILSDGAFHSGEAIAQQMGLSRAAIWKHIAKLKELGAEVYSVQGKGYRIPGGLELLDADLLYSRLTHCIFSPDDLYLFTSIASTNQYLMGLEPSERTRICLSEYQATGRGRLGRRWHSPFARNLYVSIRQRLALPIDALSGLSLSVGCAVAESLASIGCRHIKLKWPNDLRIDGAKAGGILLETAGGDSSATDVVIGFGLNWDMPSETQDEQLSQPWVNVKSYADAGVTRNQLASLLIENVIAELNTFAEHGFSAAFYRWKRFDENYQRPVKLIIGKKEVYGRCLGVDPSGALLLEDDSGVHSFVGGEISLRSLE